MVTYMERVAKKKYVLIDVDYNHIPQIGNINFKSEALIVSDYHLKMGKVDPKFRIGHFFPFLSSSAQQLYSTVRPMCLGCQLYARCLSCCLSLALQIGTYL